MSSVTDMTTVDFLRNVSVERNTAIARGVMCLAVRQLVRRPTSPQRRNIRCDRNRKAPHVLGRNTLPDTDLYSTFCAIQNLWLAARAEGIGVGWVSIIDADKVKQILNVPRHIVLVAYLCIGHPVQFEAQPMLEKVGWEKRVPLSELVFEDRWNRKWSVLDDNAA